MYISMHVCLAECAVLSLERELLILINAHLCLPGVQILGYLRELPNRVFLSGLEHAPQILDTLSNSHCRILSLNDRVWTRVKGGSESLTDLPHATAQLVSLEEQDEHHLESSSSLYTYVRVTIDEVFSCTTMTISLAIT